MYSVAKPIVMCSAEKKSFLPPNVQRLRRELESKRIQNLKKVQEAFKKTAEDDLETLLAFVRAPSQTAEQEKTEAD
jgi:hypothetical protein